MSEPHRQRAELLMQQGRHAQAEQEWRQALASDPEDGYLHARLALCLAALERYAEAGAEVDAAIGFAPDLAYPHYARAAIALDRNRIADAAESAKAALRLDPHDADLHAMAGLVKSRQERWSDALECAERALAIDPEHVDANNLRATALVHLGRKDEAGATLEATLARDPENSRTHANAGFASLHRGDHAKARQHFGEALRLDPENEPARAGLVEALKARSVVYRWMLAYFLWMQRLPGGLRFGFIVALFLIQREVSSATTSHPALAYVLWPVLGLMFGFVVLSWTASPFFNLLLRLDRDGRHALSPDQRAGSNVLAAGLALIVVNVALAAKVGGNAWWMVLLAVVLLLPTTAVYNCDRGWPRQVMGGIALVLAWTSLVTTVQFAVDAFHLTAAQRFSHVLKLTTIPDSTLVTALIGAQVAAIFLQRTRVKQ